LRSDRGRGPDLIHEFTHEGPAKIGGVLFISTPEHRERLQPDRPHLSRRLHRLVFRVRVEEDKHPLGAETGQGEQLGPADGGPAHRDARRSGEVIEHALDHEDVSDRLGNVHPVQGLLLTEVYRLGLL
jgi:hypothetical protein